MDLIVQMICTLVIWLHIHARVSRSVANTTLRALQLILATFFGLLEQGLKTAGFLVHISRIELPCDIRTAYKCQFMEPTIICTTSCPTCFSLFTGPNIPQYCEWKESPRARACHTYLWRTVNTWKGPKLVPWQQYSTQSLNNWLQFFLSRQTIEDDLKKNFAKLQQQSQQTEMHNVHDSPAWRHLNGSSSCAYDLTFGVYVDWFNPFTNKIAGEYLHDFCALIHFQYNSNL